MLDVRPVAHIIGLVIVALGAAMLFQHSARPVVEADAIPPDPALVSYAEAWRRAVGGGP